MGTARQVSHAGSQAGRSAILGVGAGPKVVHVVGVEPVLADLGLGRRGQHCDQQRSNKTEHRASESGFAYSYQALHLNSPFKIRLGTSRQPMSHINGPLLDLGM